MSSAIPLEKVFSAEIAGGKGAQLGASLRAGLPVPPGWVLPPELVSAVANNDAAAIAELEALFSSVKGPMVARSSAIGEDSNDHSFAGQHESVLGVWSFEQLVKAVQRVHQSGHSQAALAYRIKRGIDANAKIAVVVQLLVQADCAGVLFTVDPVSGKRERVIEASWGLGEAVVQGLVVPDRYRISVDGVITERIAGEKDVAVYAAEQTRAQEHPVPEEKVRALCLNDSQLRKLHELASSCEKVFGERLDLEWGFVGDALYLLQVRAVTAVGAKAR